MRLIDADALDWERIEHEHGARHEAVVDCEQMVEKAPTIDAYGEGYKQGRFDAEADMDYIVRCKDCVYRVIMRDPLRKPMDCYGCKVMHYNEDDWFCSFGERKDDD